MGELATEWVGILPWVIPAAAIAAVIAIWAGPRLASRIGAHPIVAGGILVAIGMIAGATLTPLGAEWQSGSGAAGCDLTGIQLATPGDVRRLNDAALNILLFVPLGLAVGLVREGRSRAMLIVACAFLPVGIEIIQLAAGGLGRGCQASDVVDNLTGLTVGFVTGVTIRVIAQR